MFEYKKDIFNISVLENNDDIDIEELKNYIESKKHRIGRKFQWSMKLFNLTNNIYEQGKSKFRCFGTLVLPFLI